MAVSGRVWQYSSAWRCWAGPRARGGMLSASLLPPAAPLPTPPPHTRTHAVPAGGACAQQSPPPAVAQTLREDGQATSRAHEGRRPNGLAAAARGQAQQAQQHAAGSTSAGRRAMQRAVERRRRRRLTLHLLGAHGRRVGAGEAVVHLVQDVGGHQRVAGRLQHALQRLQVLCSEGEGEGEEGKRGMRD